MTYIRGLMVLVCIPGSPQQQFPPSFGDAGHNAGWTATRPGASGRSALSPHRHHPCVLCEVWTEDALWDTQQCGKGLTHSAQMLSGVVGDTMLLVFFGCEKQFNTLRPEQTWNFADVHFPVHLEIKFSDIYQSFSKVCFWGSSYNDSALVQAMA